MRFIVGGGAGVLTPWLPSLDRLEQLGGGTSLPQSPL